MLLRRWRLNTGLTLEMGARFLGLKSAGALSDLERGIVFPSPETMARIEGATAGKIAPTDHWRAWRLAHPEQYSQFRAAGRHAAKEHRPSAKSKSKPRRA